MKTARTSGSRRGGLATGEPVRRHSSAGSCIEAPARGRSSPLVTGAAAGTEAQFQRVLVQHEQAGQHGGVHLDEVARRAGLTGTALVTAGDRTGHTGDIDAQYVIYSITKSVISAAFLLLAVEGEVALDASAGSLPGDGRFAVSVRQLLQHTSGIRREEAAQLAFISTGYYTRLKQARGPRPSREVLAGLADEDSAAVLGISRQRVNQLRNT